MKKIKYIFLSLVAIFLIAACKKFLDTAPKDGTITDASFWKTTEQFDKFVFGIYCEMAGSFNGSGVASWLLQPGIISNDILKVDEKARPLAEYMTPSSGDLSPLWVAFYKMATKANSVLANLPNAVIPEADKTRLEGEALFLRGYAYFNIARAYGNAPLILEPYSQPQNLMECTPEAQIWDQVIADLTAAAPKIPDKTQWETTNEGRATKGAVYAFLANAYMYKEDWANAEAASLSLIALNQYSLLPTVRAVFSDKNPNNVESILEVQFRNIADGKVNWNGYEAGNVLSDWTSPRNIGAEYAPGGGWGEGIANKKLADSFEPGDERRSKLMVAPGEKYKGENMTDTLLIPTDIAQPHSAFSTKYWLGPTDPGSSATYLVKQNVPLMRYAEFLLNYAEILFKQGKTAQAYQQINLIRERAKLADIAESSDPTAFMNALMKERRAELNFEPNLWWHYTRTGTAASFLLNEYAITMNPAWAKLPVPQSERDQNPNLCQNTGY